MAAVAEFDDALAKTSAGESGEGLGGNSVSESLRFVDLGAKT